MARQAAERLPPDPSEVGDEDRRALAQLISESHDQVVKALAAAPKTDSQRRLAILFDLAFAMARGLLSDDLFFGGFEAIDDVEWSDWMCGNGAKRANLRVPPSSAAATIMHSLRGIRASARGRRRCSLLRFILTYKGSVLHALTAPMGDSIIAPFYQYLRDKRNVKFEFFCRVKKLELSPDAPVVDRVILAQQVLLKNGSYYDPLIQREDGAWSWPSAPDPNQIVNGDALEGL